MLFRPAYLSENIIRRDKAIAKLSEEKRLQLFKQDLRSPMPKNIIRHFFRVTILNALRYPNVSGLDLLMDGLASTKERPDEIKDLLAEILDRMGDSKDLTAYIVSFETKDPAIVREYRKLIRKASEKLTKDIAAELYKKLGNAALRDILASYTGDPDAMKSVILDNSGAREEEDRLFALWTFSGDLAEELMSDPSTPQSLIDICCERIEYSIRVHGYVPNDRLADQIALRWIGGMKVEKHLREAVLAQTRKPRVQEALMERRSQGDCMIDGVEIGDMFTQATLMEICRDPNRTKSTRYGSRMLEDAFRILAKRGLERTRIYAMIDAAEDAEHRERMEQALANLSYRRDIPYFESMLNTPRREKALKYLRKYFEEDKFYVRYGTEDDVREMVNRVQASNMSDERIPCILRAMYKAGIGTKEIKKLRNKEYRYSVHEDYNYCGDAHITYHADHSVTVTNVFELP